MKPEFASVYIDLAEALIDLDTYKAQIFSFGFFFSGKFIKAYQKAILEGYSNAKIIIDQDLLAIHCGLRLLEKWELDEMIMKNYASAKRYITVFLKPIVRRHFKQKILEYISSDSKRTP